MKIKFYINFDLNIRGDYKGLYKWLDKNKAEERGNSYALIRDYDFPETEIKGLTTIAEKSTAFAKYLRNELKEYVEIAKTDRIYITFKVLGGDNIGGIFLFGRSQSSPWEGYADVDNNDVNFDL
ncbi:hypothetical protein [Flavobacterium sp. SM2513]|uniref:hypothetical protein n=1 Tax=Flavobacterium sp. SM2513 TaxID=3424766 RepID=UPI003D7F3D23